MYQISIIPYLLQFKQPAGTSRGVYTTHPVWYILLTSDREPEKWGVGECAPLPDLSCDASPDYEKKLRSVCCEIEQTGQIPVETLRPYPSMLFGIETAFRHFKQGSFALYPTLFSQGKTGIPINGLIWMSDYANMLKQVEEKIQSGFRCIKLKIGAIAFDEEIKLIRHIRRYFSSAEIEIRVDANGAFTPGNAPDKLNRLAELDIHSIEQPIAARQWEAMSQLCAQSPVPIALDEELIGCNQPDQKRELLTTIRPQYIILKPSLHGGISGCNEWIAEAGRLHIPWWATSALESNVALNAIAQWSATFDNPLPQGLGTGSLFHNNTDVPLTLHQHTLYFNPHRETSGYRAYFDFLAEWTDGRPAIQVRTSGSTGIPKIISVQKEHMIQSAQQTCSFLHLHAGDKALLCMPLQYIGAKMMVVRALVANLEVVIRKPSGHPLADIDRPVDFAAMTPQQVYNSLLIPEEKTKLRQIKNVLIGGGAIDPVLVKELRTFPNAVYSTYGMTETVSHIALRRLSGKEASDSYRPFPSVKLSLSPTDTLIICAPFALNGEVVTNDIAEIHADGSFRILGRADNVINSGGVKIQPERLEEILKTVIPHPFAITAMPDAKFGEVVVLLTEQPITPGMHTEIQHHLTKLECPKRYITVPEIPHTANGKIDRTKCREIE